MIENEDMGAPSSSNHSLATVLAFAAQGDTSAHPEPETLLAYHEGTLAEEESEKVQAHLAACHTCAGALLDLADFVDTEESQVADFETAAAWRAMRPTLAEETAREATSAATPTRRRSFATIPYAAAAALLLTTIGLGLRTLEQQSRLTELSAPQLNVPVVYLDAVTRAESESADLQIPTGSGRVMIFATPSPSHFTSYRVELLGAQGDLLWHAEGLETSENETLRLILPSRLLHGGDKELRLFGIEGEQRLPAGTHPLRIRSGD